MLRILLSAFFVITSSPRRSSGANQVPVVPDVQQWQDALAVPPAQAGAAQNQAQDAQNVDGGEQPAAVAAPVAVPAAQPVHVPDADVVSCSCPLLAYLLTQKGTE